MRRAIKTVYHRQYNSQTQQWSWVESYKRKFAYAGWLLLAEFDGSDQVLKSYTGAFDMAGSVSGGGGGGLGVVAGPVAMTTPAAGAVSNACTTGYITAQTAANAAVCKTIAAGSAIAATGQKTWDLAGWHLFRMYNYLSPAAGAPRGISSAKPITDPSRMLPAPAAGEVASEGGHIVSFVQPQGQFYWRVYSGDATMGRWLTAVGPRSAAWAREALALPPGNTAQFVQRVFVPEGTVLQRSRALGVFGHRGGAEQFRLFEFLPAENFGPGVPLK